MNNNRNTPLKYQYNVSGCSATAELMYQGTAMLGCASFIEGQKVACDCSIRDSNQHASNKQKSKTSKVEL